MFDWLKVSAKSKPSATKPITAGGNLVRIDSRSYPLTDLSRTGFTATGFDGTLAAGQRAKVTVVVNDRIAKFDFHAAVEIALGADKGQFTGSWTILPPEVEAAILHHIKHKRAAGVRSNPR